MKKTVLHVLAMSTYSGAENVVCQIINMFSDDKDIRMIYCSPDGAIRKVLESKGITYEPMARLSLCELRKVIKKVRPDIVHAHDVKATFYSALCCKKAVLVSHMHNNWENLRRFSIKGFIYLLSVKKASKIIWVSDSSFSQYRYSGKLKSKSKIIKNIVDVAQIRSAAEVETCKRRYDVVYVGRLTYQKNPERLIKVLETAVKKNSNLSAAIIGDGDLMQTVRTLIDQKGLGTNIELLGYVQNPLGIMKSSSVFLLTSRWEGTPMVVLEALALGVPVVGTPVDGMLDLVQNGENGYLSENDELLASHLTNIISNKKLHDDLSNKAIEYSNKKNSIDEYKLAIKNVYEESTCG